MPEPASREEVAALTAAVTDLVDALRRGRSADNPALLEELNALAQRLRSL